MLEDQRFFECLERETGVILNGMQKQAICHPKGPMLLLATPGAGKTTVLNARILYLIIRLGVNPENILALTFSKAAAKEMSDRFQRVYGQLVKQRVQFSTIHSFSYNIVRTYFYEKCIAYSLIENEQGVNSKNSVLKRLYESINQMVLTEDKLEELANAICFIKNSMMKVSDIEMLDTKIKDLVLIYEAYENYKKNAHPGIILIDFDDMLTLANRILEENPEILSRYQKQFPFVLTDESQDNSFIQNKIIEKVAKLSNNLFVVGDDDQSIFGFRSANPKYLLDFKRVHPGARILMMEQNYRSTQEIVKVTNEFISGNQQRYLKTMFTENPSDKSIQIKSFEYAHQQLNYVIEELKKKKAIGQTALLYRNNVSAIKLIDHLDSANLPFYVRDSGNKFFNHWVIKDIINFMRFSYSDKNVGILEILHTKFDSYISKQQIEYLKHQDQTISVFDHLADIPNLPAFRKKNFLELKRQFKKLNEMNPLDAIRFIRKELNYEKKQEEFSERLGLSIEGIRGILATLESIAQGMKTLKHFADRLKHLEQLMRESVVNKDDNSVTLSTLHSAKGLEFESVYMLDLVDGILPNRESIKSAEMKKIDSLEEERRLFYVGMTRAKKELELLTVENLNDQDVIESQFVGEVREILCPGSSQNGKDTVNLTTFKLEKGANIRHKAFGIGRITVADVRLDLLEVNFRKLGVKQFSLKVCLEGNLVSSVL
ncbi:ATP-dependent helicase [Desulfosporosinus sp. Sb-LF]|uniref:ATP-dependent helicase n=1 Tax=Desulfosporosinus sp. Sb-LF TaxID=2560027 RepID=UPI00107EF238|nr:ATP-dependent helicase [Desulfosporosinus sp. Sb-LF]TGE31615.1 ATP-dependent helicase [Desulfosporosinus sp. Sb-LF]